MPELFTIGALSLLKTTAGKLVVAKIGGLFAKSTALHVAASHGGMGGAAAAAKAVTIKATGSALLGDMAQTATTELIFAGATWPLVPHSLKTAIAIVGRDRIGAAKGSQRVVRTFFKLLDDDTLDDVLS